MPRKEGKKWVMKSEKSEEEKRKVNVEWAVKHFINPSLLRMPEFQKL